MAGQRVLKLRCERQFKEELDKLDSDGRVSLIYIYIYIYIYIRPDYTYIRPDGLI
jgi:hypothetical protein